MCAARIASTLVELSSTLNVSLNWLKKQTLASVVLGAVGGPLAYLAGQRLGAVTIPQQTLGVLAQAGGWAVLTPLLVRLATHFNGFGPAAVRRLQTDV